MSGIGFYIRSLFQVKRYSKNASVLPKWYWRDWTKSSIVQGFLFMLGCMIVFVPVILAILAWG